MHIFEFVRYHEHVLIKYMESILKIHAGNFRVDGQKDTLLDIRIIGKLWTHCNDLHRWILNTEEQLQV